MPLRDVQLSDDAPHILLDRCKEARRDLTAARERIEELEGGMKRLLGLLSMLSKNESIPLPIRETLPILLDVIDAQEMLRPCEFKPAIAISW